MVCMVEFFYERLWHVTRDCIAMPWIRGQWVRVEYLILKYFIVLFWNILRLWSRCFQCIRMIRERQDGWVSTFIANGWIKDQSWLFEKCSNHTVHYTMIMTVWWRVVAGNLTVFSSFSSSTKWCSIFSVVECTRDGLLHLSLYIEKWLGHFIFGFLFFSLSFLSRLQDTLNFSPLSFKRDWAMMLCLCNFYFLPFTLFIFFLFSIGIWMKLKWTK